jgi:hypothetical protein
MGPRYVIEVRTLGYDDDEPAGESWVLVERRSSHYFITGRQDGKAINTSVQPTGFDSPEAAIRAAATWADLLSSPILYVRGKR